MRNKDFWITLLISAVIVAIIFGVVAIVNPGLKLHEGTVVDKKFTPAHVEEVHSVRLIGKVLMPYSYDDYIEDDYDILVRGKTESGEEIVEWWDVDSASYESVKVGDRVSRKE